MKFKMKNNYMNHDAFIKEIDEIFEEADKIFRLYKDSVTDLGKIEREMPELNLESSEPKPKEEINVYDVKFKVKNHGMKYKGSKSLL